MATPHCIKCGGSSFELNVVEPADSNYKLNFVQCSNCGGVVGVLDYFNIGTLVRKLAKSLNIDVD